MGQADTPPRRILNYAQDRFCRHLPLVFVLTVIGPRNDWNVPPDGERTYYVSNPALGLRACRRRLEQANSGPG